MAKKEQYVLLESIFDAACIIENEAAGGDDGTPPKKGWLASVKDALGGAKNSLKNEFNLRKDYIKQGYADNGVRGVGSAVKDVAINDISTATSGIKKGALATGRHVKGHKTAYGAGLLGIGATGAGAYALHNKIAGLLTGHHDEDEA
jgi:hypothetical protein